MGVNSVVIVAAGKGKRMKMDKSKQFVELMGIPLIVRTIKKFQNSQVIDEIILVVGEDDINYVRDEIVDRYSLNKVFQIVAGGAERQESVLKGIKTCSAETEIVLIHDGARPFINEQLIIDSIEYTKKNNCCIVAVPVKDTIKLINIEGIVERTIDRNLLWAIQTPQTFKKDIIQLAHEKALIDNFTGTDDSMLVERIGYQVKVINGSYYNIKITTPEDLLIAETFIKAGF